MNTITNKLPTRNLIMKKTEKIKMKADIKTLSVIIAYALTLIFAGCSQIEESAKVVFNPDSIKPQQSTATPERFHASDS